MVRDEGRARMPRNSFRGGRAGAFGEEMIKEKMKYKMGWKILVVSFVLAIVASSVVQCREIAMNVKVGDKKGDNENEG